MTAFGSEAAERLNRRERPVCPRTTKVGSPPGVRGANGSDLSVLSKGKRVFYINS